MNRRYNSYSEELEDKIVDLYKEGYNTLEIGKLVGIKYNTSIRRVLLRKGVDLISNEIRNRVVKTNPFQDLTLPEVQYWLGYLAADGCISRRSKNPSKIRLNTNTDPEHLETYAKFIGYGVKVTSSRNNRINVNEYVVYFSNAEISAYLIELGITERKSLTLDIKFDFDWNFIRGYFDGNGCVQKREIQIATGSDKFAKQISDFYNKEGIWHTSKKRKNTTLVSVFKLVDRAKWSKKVYRDDFSEELCLQRKKIKVISFSSLE